MVTLSVSTVNFTNAIKRYAEMTGKELSEVVKEQAKLVAARLVKFTYPKSASQGKKRVEIDISRVFLKNSWFEEKFSFRNQKLGDRVKSLVYAKDEGGLRDVFQNSNRLRLIRIEPFSPAQHARMRRNGRVLVPDPRSFPLTQQSQVKAYTRQKQKNVGIAKSGWAAALAFLGKSVPAWLNKSGTGSAQDDSRAKSPSITLINKVNYFSQLDAKANIVSRALDGRASAMIASARRQLAIAAKAAGFDSH